MAAIYFITGTDTGVGKTVLTALLVRQLRAQGVRALAVKPVCSGGRADARLLRRAQSNELTLDEINPWHFRAPVAPVLAARRERRRLKMAQVLDYVAPCAGRCDVLLIEGAGGLLSPLGEGFDSRDLIAALRATPIIVCPDRLGAVNQARLVITALEASAAEAGIIVLAQLDSNRGHRQRANSSLLAEHCPGCRIFELPFRPDRAGADGPVGVRQQCGHLLAFIKTRSALPR